MAPKKRSRNDEKPAAAAGVTSKRVTRSSTSSNTTLTARSSTSSKTTSTVTSPLPAKKKPKTQVSKALVENPTKPAAHSSSSSKTIVIEHCKQCNQFKTRAIKVKEALENDISGITVLVNPEKPRRGCFEVREEGGDIFISLLDMKRPFQPMRALDMDQVISDIIDKLK